jgi:hypothetical protein
MDILTKFKSNITQNCLSQYNFTLSIILLFSPEDIFKKIL